MRNLIAIYWANDPMDNVSRRSRVKGGSTYITRRGEGEMEYQRFDWKQGVYQRSQGRIHGT